MAIIDRWITKDGKRKDRYRTGRRYKVTYRTPSGQPKSQAFSNRADAERFAAKTIVEDGAVVNRRTRNKTTVRMIAEAYRENPMPVGNGYDLADGTLEMRGAGRNRHGKLRTGGHLRAIIDHFGDTPMHDVATSRNQVREFIEHLRTGDATTRNRPRSNATINRHLVTLRLLFSYAWEAELVDEPITPARFRKLPEQRGTMPASLNINQLHRIVDCAPDEWRVFFLLATRSGMRQGELRGLTVDRLRLSEYGSTVAVDQQADRVHRDRFATVKGKENREISLPGDIADVLRHHLAATAERRAKRPDLNLVFPAPCGRMLAKITVSRAWRSLKATAKLPGEARFHDIRVAYGSHLIRATRDLAYTARVLGHATDSVTMRHYVKEMQNADKTGADAIEAVFAR